MIINPIFVDLKTGWYGYKVNKKFTESKTRDYTLDSPLINSSQLASPIYNTGHRVPNLKEYFTTGKIIYYKDKKKVKKMVKEIKGIFHIESESDIFDESIIPEEPYTEKSMGIKASLDWELDKISLDLSDKEGNLFGSLVFDCDEFKRKIENLTSPTDEELKEQDKEMAKMTKEEVKEMKKDALEDFKEMQKNPIKDKIEKYHEV